MNRGGNGGNSGAGGAGVGPSFPAVKAGSLRRKLTIQKRDTTTSDGYLGASSGNWVNVISTWGSVTAKQSTALLQLIAGQQMPKTVYDVIVRYPPSTSILPGMRILDGPRTYTISNVNDTDERHRILHLACVQEPAAP